MYLPENPSAVGDFPEKKQLTLGLHCPLPVSWTLTMCSPMLGSAGKATKQDPHDPVDKAGLGIKIS